MPKKHKPNQNSKKNQNSHKVNFSNRKTQAVISHLQLGENRISKVEILSLANKDILYQLKNSGFIREQSKGQFVGTSKLHNYVKRTTQTSFSSSKSPHHSQQLRNSLHLAPRSVIEKKHFQTAPDIEKHFNQKVYQSPQYQKRLSDLKSSCQKKLHYTEQKHQQFLHSSSSHSSTMRYQEKIDYYKEKERHLAELKVCNQERPFLLPDYSLRMNKDELNEYIQNLTDYRDSLLESSKAYSLYNDSIETLRTISTGVETEIIIAVEIVSPYYSREQMIEHQYYSTLSDTPQIFLM